MAAASRPASVECPYPGLGMDTDWRVFLASGIVDSVNGSRFPNVLEWYLGCWYPRAKEHACSLESMQIRAERRMNACLPFGYTVETLEMTWKPHDDIFQLKAASRRNFAISCLAGADASAVLQHQYNVNIVGIARDLCTAIGKVNVTEDAAGACNTAVALAMAEIHLL